MSDSSSTLVDLRSDTVTQPTAACATRCWPRRWATTCSATTRASMRCRKRSPALLGFEAALFVPTGTQSNLCAILSHCQRGDEYIVGQMAHCYRWEGGGAAVFGSVQPQPLNHQPDGTLALAEIEAAIKPDDAHFARTRLLALENTLGGKLLPFAYVRAGDGAGAAQGPGTPSRWRAAVQRGGGAGGADAAPTRAPKRAASPAASTACRSASARAWARRSARRCAARASSSRARTASARWPAAACARPACWRRRPRMRWTTMSSAWPRTMRWRSRLAEGLAGIDGLQVEAPQTNIAVRRPDGRGARALGRAAGAPEAARRAGHRPLPPALRHPPGCGRGRHRPRHRRRSGASSMPERAMPTLLLFIAAGLLLNLTPGPDVLYIVSHALRSGARAGIVAGLGITAGCFVHIFAAALGVSALMAASATAFTVLKWVGAAYLLWVGVRMLLSRPRRTRRRWPRRRRCGRRRQPEERLPRRLLDQCAESQGGAVLPGLRAAVHRARRGQQGAGLLAAGRAVQLQRDLRQRRLGAARPAGWRAASALVQRGMHWLERGAGALFVGFGLKLALSDNPLAPIHVH